MKRSLHMTRRTTALVLLAGLAAAAPTLGTPSASASAPEVRARQYAPAGAVSAWGLNTSWQTVVPSKLEGRDVVAISAGPSTSLALTRDGAVTGWGWNGEGQAAPPSDLDYGIDHAVAIDAGDHHSLAVLADGSVQAWGAAGLTDEGQADVPAELRGPTPAVRAVEVAAGRWHSLALTSDGRVIGWGAEERNQAIDYGQADPHALMNEGGRKIVDIAAGAYHSLAVDNYGGLWHWGDDPHHADLPPDSLAGKDVVQAAAAAGTSMVLTRAGEVMAWGDPTTGTTSVPSSLTGERVVQIDLGNEVATALTATGRVVTWGRGATPVPGAVDEHAPFSAVAAGGQHVLVLHRTPLPEPTPVPTPAPAPTPGQPGTPGTGTPSVPTTTTVRAPRRVTTSRSRARVEITVRVTGATSGDVVLTERRHRLARVGLTRATAKTGVATIVVRLEPGTHTLRARYTGSDAAASSDTAEVVVRRTR